jgi:hypothetical protein
VVIPKCLREAIIGMPLQESSMSSEQHGTATAGRFEMERNASAPLMAIPPGHVGEFVIPGTGRRVWWTGRVAIGLLHQPGGRFDSSSRSALWIQDLMRGKPAHAGH